MPHLYFDTSYTVPHMLILSTADDYQKLGIKLLVYIRCKIFFPLFP